MRCISSYQFCPPFLLIKLFDLWPTSFKGKKQKPMKSTVLNLVF